MDAYPKMSQPLYLDFHFDDNAVDVNPNMHSYQEKNYHTQLAQLQHQQYAQDAAGTSSANSITGQHESMSANHSLQYSATSGSDSNGGYTTIETGVHHLMYTTAIDNTDAKQEVQEHAMADFNGTTFMGKRVIVAAPLMVRQSKIMPWPKDRFVEKRDQGQQTRRRKQQIRVRLLDDECSYVEMDAVDVEPEPSTSVPYLRERPAIDSSVFATPVRPSKRLFEKTAGSSKSKKRLLNDVS